MFQVFGSSLHFVKLLTEGALSTHFIAQLVHHSFAKDKKTKRQKTKNKRQKYERQKTKRQKDKRQKVKYKRQNDKKDKRQKRQKHFVKLLTEGALSTHFIAQLVHHSLAKDKMTK